MIYLSLSTKNRFWNFALTMLCLANADRPANLRVMVYDDHTDDGSQDAKRVLVDDLRDRVFGDRAIEYFRSDRQYGYNTLFYIFMSYPRELPEITHWFHLDDDLCFAPDTLVRMLADYDRWLRRGALYGFVNAWQNFLRGHCNGPLHHVRELGGCMFLMSRATALSIRDVFSTPEKQRGRHEEMWAELRRLKETQACRIEQPYQVQHTANADSMLWGKKPQWRDAWSKHLRTGELIDVPGYPIAELRAAVDGGRLEQFVRAANERAKVKIVTPPAS